MKKLFLAAAVTLALASNANAYDRSTLLLGLGVDNLRDSTADGKTNGIQAPEGRVEWRGKAFDNIWGITRISPMAGVDVDTNGSFAVFGGFLYDWNFYGNWSLVPNIGVSAYHEGDGKDLGGWLEFHDSIGLDYKISQSNRIGLELTHMSNASIYSHNPGKEDLMVTYSLGL